MKKFLLGALAATLVFSLSISALAISGRMTIEVDPINIQVNGETFVPRDVNGAEVPVFAYNGTTYAPLRALAEAYGLEVGYDASANMATVQAIDTPQTSAKRTGNAGARPSLAHGVANGQTNQSTEGEKTYLEFKGLWEVSKNNNMEMFANPVEWCGVTVNPMETDLYHAEITVKTILQGYTEARSFYEENILDDMALYADEMCEELYQDGKNTYVVFMINGYNVYEHMRQKDGTVTIKDDYPNVA